MTLPLHISQVASNYLVNSNLGFIAQAAGAEDKNINDIIDEKTSITDKVRFMDANTSVIQAIKLNFEAGVIGIKTGVQFKFKDKDGNLDKKLNDQAEAEWSLFCKKEFFEVKGDYHCDNILRQIVKAEKGAEGEVLILHHIDPDLRFGYVTQLLETSMIDTSKDEPAQYHENTKALKEYATVSGLKLGKYGKVESVWIFDDGVVKDTSTLYNRSQFTLYFNPHLRISQYRGIPQISGAIGVVQDTITYKNNELKASTAASSTKFVHKTDVIKPLITAQKAYWERRFEADKGMPSVHDFSTEDQSNSPTAYIGLDEELTALRNESMKSVFDTFRKNEKETLAQNFSISTSSLMQGEDSAVFAVVKAKKQENETRYGIEQDNLKGMMFSDIINKFIFANATKWGIKDFYKDEYKYYYKYTITMGTKTELDEVKSANARKINKKQKIISSYDAANQLGNDLDNVLEANTRAKKKEITEKIKLLKEMEELNKAAEPLGIRYTLDEEDNIVQIEEVKQIEGEKK